MKHIISLSIAFLAAAAASTAMAQAPQREVVILHTNDTHSQIDPDRHKGKGGVLRRKALVDSVRQAVPATIVVDAGDAVQGTLYYTLFGGEVEQQMLNDIGYDIQIMGNHEFDNGMEAMARNYSRAQATLLSANTTFDGTPLEGMLQPYVVKEAGGRRIGFIGININPEGLISPQKSQGVVYHDAVEVIDSLARKLRAENAVDAVVVVSHIGYSGDNSTTGYTDIDLAARCPDIDVIIGGHSHTSLTPDDPRTRIVQADGDTVLVVQNGKGGNYVGEVVLAFDDAGHVHPSWRRHAVDARYDRTVDPAMAASLEPYREKVDSVYSIKVTDVPAPFDASAMGNFAADFVRARGSELPGVGHVDFAIMNKGGIRQQFEKGPLTRGNIIDVFPFDNRVVVLDIKGDSLATLFDTFAKQGGQCVSYNVTALMNTGRTGCSWVSIDGKDIDPQRTYRVATIDYLAEGGDNMHELRSGRLVAKSPNVLYDDIIAALQSRKTLTPDSTQRMK